MNQKGYCVCTKAGIARTVVFCRPGPGYGAAPAQNTATGGPSNPVPQQGSVMMVYGLNLDKVNPDKLFNIFCLYGNVVRVRPPRYTKIFQLSSIFNVVFLCSSLAPKVILFVCG